MQYDDTDADGRKTHQFPVQMIMDGLAEHMRPV